MIFASLILSSVASLIEIFYQNDIAKDIQATYLDINANSNANYFLPSDDTNLQFDFIVVGAGSAGSIVAGRLAASGRFRVGLFESGGDVPPQSFVPGLYDSYTYSPHMTYQYKASLQNSGGGEVKMNIPVGKVLGGTGILNSMIFNRGSPFDYDNWANLTGDADWNYQNILQYFKKMETYQGDFPSDQHGTTGPMIISPQSYAPGLETWLAAGAELGYPTKDPNGPQENCFSPFEYNTQNGRRDSSYTAYIERKLDALPNLKIIKYADVTQILFDENRASGIVYKKHGVFSIAKATKEVIVSCGTFGSPQLLMRSGIGPAGHLAELNIPLVANLPVGEYLQDHVYIPMKFTLDDPTHIHNQLINITQAAVDEFLDKGTGPMTSTTGKNAQAYIASTYAISEGFPNWPDIQFLSYSQNFHSYPFLSNEGDDGHAVYVLVQLGRPKSVGAIRLGKMEGEDDQFITKINLNFLSDLLNRDRLVLLEGIKILLEVFEQTEAYKKVGAKYPQPNLEACDEFSFRSDEYWFCYIDKTIEAGLHHSGTCRMGRVNDLLAVVDSKLRVLQVNGLRVIDSSVMPTVTNANIQAAVFLIAEKGAADILAEYDT